jgi:hypothetical protein
MKLLLLLILLLIVFYMVYMFYTNRNEHFTPSDIEKENASKILEFLKSDVSYVSYLTFINDEKIPYVGLLDSNIYNTLNNAIKDNTLTSDNLNLIYNYF